MAEKRRDPHEVKDIGIKRLKDSYEKTNQRQCSPEKLREIEKFYTKEILPRVYEGDNK